MEQTNEWGEGKKNLLSLVEKYPARIGDALDSAYLAGLDELEIVLKQEYSKGHKAGYEEGYRNRRDDRFQEGKHAALTELLDELPKEKETNNKSNDHSANPAEWNVTRLGFNEALLTIRALIEGKLTK